MVSFEQVRLVGHTGSPEAHRDLVRSAVAVADLDFEKVLSPEPERSDLKGGLPMVVAGKAMHRVEW